MNSVVPGGVWGGVGWGFGRNGDWASNVVLYLAHFWSYHACRCVTIEGLRLARLLSGLVRAALHSRVVRERTHLSSGTQGVFLGLAFSLNEVWGNVTFYTNENIPKVVALKL